MSTMEAIRIRIRSLPKGKPFTASRFVNCGQRGAVDRALSRIVHEGQIERLSHGVFVRPRKNRFVGNVVPGFFEVVQAIARDNGETIQIHGAEAARRFGFSTQVPTTPVFHTNASSRSIRIGNIAVKMIHTSNRRRLQFAGEPAGMALSALWYLGKDIVTPETVAAIKSAMGKADFEKLRSADVPAWMATALNASTQDATHG